MDFPLYLAQIDVVGLSKIPLLAIFIITVIFHFQRSIKTSAETILFLWGGGIAFLVGIFEGYFLKPSFFTHIYATLMPVFAISFGRYFYLSLNSSVRLSFYRLMEYIFYCQIAMLIAYFYFYYYLESWSYFGFGTGIGFAATYMLSSGRSISYIVGLIFDFFSGKRSGVLALIFVSCWYLFHRRINNRILIFAPLLLLFLGLYWLQSAGLLGDIFRRFELIGQFDLDDLNAVFLATGGRLTEVFDIIDFMRDKPYRWLFGSGMGAQYLFVDPREGFYPEYFHYAHFSPFGYVFLYGVPFTVVFYVLLISRVISGVSLSGDFFYLAFIFLMTASFFGANLFIDPRVWIFYGFVIQAVRGKF